MPELPEVETVRDGLSRWITGRAVDTVEVRHPRAVRRHAAGADDFAERLVGRRIDDVRRRGKFLWADLSDGSALIMHLGMSGQLLVQPPDAPDETHLRVRLRFDDGGRELRFVDQRTFGGLIVDSLVATPDGPDTVPSLVAHIGRDPLDPSFDERAWSRRLRARHTELKRALLDQTLASGIGNIYADESLWRARLHPRRATERLPAARAGDLLGDVRAVLTEALRAGGTSFDALYVNVNGQSGYFDRSLAAYGQRDRPCPRCGTPIRREAFMNRSSFFCPTCQRPSRAS